MERQNEQSGSLISWVDLSRKDQARWIVRYLSSRQAHSELARYLVGQNVTAEVQYRQAISSHGATLESVIQAKIMDDYSLGLIQNDLNSQLLMRRMRGAWQQKSYREKGGKQVNFQLPEDVADEIEKIARDRGQSRTYTLKQMVDDGVDAFNRGSERTAQRAVKLERQLRKTHQNAQAIESALGGWAEILLEALAEEVVTRFHCEVLDNASHEDAAALFEMMIEKRVAELAAQAPPLRRRGSRIRPVKDYFTERLQQSLKGE